MATLLYGGSVVEQKYFLPYANLPFFQFVPLSPETSWQERTLADMLTLFHLLQEKPFGFELDAYSYLLQIWKALLENLEDAPAKAPFMERPEAQTILAYLHEHYAETITLQAVADHVHLSQGECCRLFKATYGCTLVTYLTDYRLQQSIILLADPSRSVSQIAELCGFNSTSYFIKRFREKVGFSPLQYRSAVKKTT